MTRTEIINMAIWWIVQLHPDIYSKFSENKRNQLILEDAEEMAEFTLYIISLSNNYNPGMDKNPVQTYPNTVLLRNAFEAETCNPCEVYWEGTVENPAYTCWLESKLIAMESTLKEAFSEGARRFSTEDYTTMQLDREFNDWNR